MAAIRCAVVDDEPLALGLMASYVKKTPFLELVGAYSSAVQAMQEMHDHPVDLVFLDIQMPELNGLDYSRMIPPQTRVIFTTAFNQYAIDGYKVNALDYLLKPISYPDFLQAANKAQDWFKLVEKSQQTEQPEKAEKAAEIQSIYVKSEYKLIQIELKNILYIEGLKDYVKIYEENAPKPIMSLMSMKSLEEMLPSDRFMRVHRSYIVQKEKIRIIEHNRIVFGNTYIPIGDSYKQAFQDYLNKRS
jgi:DNA-binding LytR/AlgR family response regulator